MKDTVKVQIKVQIDMFEEQNVLAIFGSFGIHANEPMQS